MSTITESDREEIATYLSDYARYLVGDWHARRAAGIINPVKTPDDLDARMARIWGLVAGITSTAPAS